MKEEQKRPLIFNLRRFALDDGPGIRTTVFLKGCPLACVWCHNPESMASCREIAFHGELCIACGECEKICPEEAVKLGFDKRMIREKCNACGLCVKACPSTALKVVGSYFPVPELTEELLKDLVFYQTSQGGVTFSGGEPTLYMDYVADVMKRLKEKEIHIAIQTSGMFDLLKFEEVLLPHIDLIYYDMKLYDSSRHMKYTGKTNELILENLVRLKGRAKVPIVPRIPLVPDITATEENIVQVGRFLREIGFSGAEILPYNSGGLSGWVALGKDLPQGVPRRTLGNKEKDRLKSLLAATFALSHKESVVLSKIT